VRALIHTSAEAGYDYDLLRSVVDVNESQFERMVSKVDRLVDNDLEGITVAALGLAFKAGTDDLRDSPALAVIDRLLDRGAVVRAHDPAVAVLDGRDVEVCADAYDAAAGADILVLLTEWEDYRRLDYDRLAEVMAGRAVVDTRNVLDRDALARRGFEYESVGRS
jgi:UDPglucose 6-dehydrogenase